MKTKLYMLEETSLFMMSFVIETSGNNVIIVDGGREEDMPLLKKYVKGRHIKAWILTHPHIDHISGFVSEMKKNGCQDFDIETVYYNFPDYDYLINKTEGILDREYFEAELNEMLPEFNAISHVFSDKAHIVKQGEEIMIDDLKIEFLYVGRDGLYANIINDFSLVFKVHSANKTVLFLGDLGPDGGDALFRESHDKLKADIVQMAHHGHMNVSMEVYEAISPTVCLWCAPDWLYNEPIIPHYLADTEKLIRCGRIRMYGAALTRRWMEALGVKEHYVTANGTQEIEL